MPIRWQTVDVDDRMVEQGLNAHGLYSTPQVGTQTRFNGCRCVAITSSLLVSLLIKLQEVIHEMHWTFTTFDWLL